MFVIPMAGRSSRFFEAGYKVPKYMLQAFGRSLFAHALCSFEKYFDRASFLFVVADAFDAENFVRTECERLKIANVNIVTLAEATRGQAETVLRGLESVGRDVGAITIFNIDTAVHGFQHPKFYDACDGYLDVFVGTGANWSYVQPASGSQRRVLRTAEKEEISNLCSTGLYYFASAEIFCAACSEQLEVNPKTLAGNEVYIAPLYNTLISEGKDVRYRIQRRQNIVFFGTPEEYQSVLDEQSSVLKTRGGAHGQP